MKIKLFSLFLLLMSGAANATCTTTGNITNCYDAQSGNSSTTTKMGNTSYTNSYNTNTGTNWNSNTIKSGSTSITSGTSSSGATWNSSTTNGTTMHSGTKSDGTTYVKTCDAYGNCY